MQIREAKDCELEQILQLHIASIKHFCAEFYPAESIRDWINTKSIEAYKSNKGQILLWVAEDNQKIVGFGLLNLFNNSIDSLYIAPNFNKRGYGRKLLETIELVARNKGIKQLNLSSTLNAHQFYQKMGYQGEVKSVYTLSTGAQLNCVHMVKSLSK